MDNRELYETLKKEMTADKLKELSMRIIEAYKLKKYSLLEAFADAVFTEHSGERSKNNRLFLQLIKHFHPDRLNSIHKEIEEAYLRNNRDKLVFFDNMLSADKKAQRLHSRKFDHPYEEEYWYGKEDFGFDTTAYNEGVFSEEADTSEDETGYSESVENFDFIKAVKAEHLGNLDYMLTPADLSFLEGELILSGYELEDLGGLEYCVNITSLDLSENEITSIYEIQYLEYLKELFLSHNHLSDIDDLKGLTELEILDLSFNDIEDISVLLSINGLKFVNVTGNPIADLSDIRALEERAVVVIY